MYAGRTHHEPTGKLTAMPPRPRRSRYSYGQWQVQRDRFQIESAEPAPTTEHLSTVRDSLLPILKSLGLEQNSLQQRLMQQWNAIAGHPLCRHIRPGPLQDGQLTVYVSNSTMLSELSRFQGPALLKNLQAATGASAIRKLRFLLDPDTRQARRGA